MNRMIDNNSRIRSAAPNQIREAKAPAPTVDTLTRADRATAGASVDAMTRPQRKTLKAQVEQMPVAERGTLANHMATVLDPGQLRKVEPAFGRDLMRDAIFSRSPAEVRDEYMRLSVSGSGVRLQGGASEHEQTEQAQEDYADDVEGHGILAQHALADLMVDNVDNPAYLAELVRLAQEEGTLDMVVNPMYGGLFEKEGGEYVVTNDTASFDADARRDAFAQAISAAMDAGVLSQTDVRGLAADSPGWADVASLAGLDQVGSISATQTTQSELTNLLDNYNEARDAAQELDTELGSLLAQAGPMTPEQQTAFVEAFRSDPDNAEVYALVNAETSALSTYLTENRDAVMDAAVRDPAVAEQVRDALVAMADEGRGVEALELLTHINAGGPESALAQAFAGFDELSGPVLENAAAAAMTQLLERNNGDTSTALVEFKDLIKNLSDAARSWKGGQGEFEAGLALLDQAAAGNVGALQVYLDGYDGMSPISKALAAAGLVTGAVGAINAGTQGDYVNMIGGFASTGESAARLVAGMTGSVAAVGQALEGTAAFGNFAARLAPALGLIASSASLVNSINQAADGNVGYGLAMVGDIVGVLGSAFEMFPPSAPAGFILSGVGAVISGLGSALGEIINSYARREDLKRYLEEAGVDPAIVDPMALSGKQLVEMGERLQLTPEQVQALVLEWPQIGDAPGYANALTEVAAALGITGNAEVTELAARLARSNPDFAADLMSILGTVSRGDPNQTASALRDYVEGRYPDAAAFAEQVSPELFGPDAEQRERAQTAFNQVMGSGSWELGLANALKGNDSPAYRAEMMRLLADRGGSQLDLFAQTIAGYGDQWAGAVRDAVADALAAGTLTQAEADRVLNHF